ncbi:putative FAD-linked oxidoreductase [Anaerolineae bacterium]|nr:putative FAD-linked oxidoreductase [Anaerolineae bacterium]
MLRQDAKQSLETLLNKKQITTHPVELITYEIDAGPDRGAPDGVVFPKNADEVARLMRWANAHNVPLIARGAGTGLSGGAVAEQGGVIVEFSRMNRIIEFDPAGRSAVVEPGIFNLALDAFVKQKGLYYPPDPASQRASTIGGNVAENAGGPHCFKYGVTTNYVTGLRVVLADGRMVRVGGRANDYPEYDLVGLLVGSEGTLGIITSVDVRLVRNPPGVKTMMVTFDSIAQAGNAVSAIIASGFVPATMELMDRKIAQMIEDYAHAGLPTDAGAVIIIEADGYAATLDAQIEEIADILQANHARNIRIAQSAEERERIWYARKSAAGAIARLAAGHYTVDITVPRSRLAETIADVDEIIARYKLNAGHLLHAGDGNLHPLILISDLQDQEQINTIVRAGREIAQVAIKKDGSITGEHGVGIEKREFMPLMYSGAELAAMRDVKEVFDPRGLLNPGKIFPEHLPPVERARDDGELPGEVFTPATVDEAARGIAACAKANWKLEIGNWKLEVGSSKFTRLTTTALTGIKAYAPDDLYVTVGAGMQLVELQEFLARDHKQVPLASPWRDATIGGIVAANVNAPLRMRYGGLRDLVLAMTVALGDGRVIRAGRPVVKNVAGYDLTKVFVGSHGTLGLICDVTLKLTPLPRMRRSLLVPVDDLARGLEWGSRLLPVALVASAVVIGRIQNSEFRILNSPYLLAYTAEGTREEVEAELAQACEVLIANRAPTPVEVESPAGTDIWQNVLASALDESRVIVRAGVPAKEIAAFAQSIALEQSAFVVDVANGLAYAARRAANRDGAPAWLDAMRRQARTHAGYAVVMHASAESRDALDVWGGPPETLDVMRALKARWDPRGILNPGVFVV